MRQPIPTRQLAALLLLVGFLFTTSGCANQPPIEKAYMTRALYNQMVSNINTARANNLVEDKTFDTLNDAYHDVSDLLDELDVAAVKAEASNTPIALNFDFKKVYQKVIDKLNQFSTQYATAKRGFKPAHATP